MSEFDKYAFEQPVDLSENPEAVRAMTELIEAVLPLKIDQLPKCTLETSATFVIDDCTTATVEMNPNDGAPLYSVAIENSYPSPDVPDLIKFEKTSAIVLEPSENRMILAYNIESEYDRAGDMISVKNNRSNEQISYVLFRIAAALELIPGSMKTYRPE